MNEVDESEVERRLQNWARWWAGGCVDGRGGDAGGSRGVSSIYAQRPVGQRSGYRIASVPVLALDAQQTQAAIDTLHETLADALVAWYRRVGPPPDRQRFYSTDSQEAIADALGISRRTFVYRLGASRRKLREALFLLKN